MEEEIIPEGYIPLDRKAVSVDTDAAGRRYIKASDLDVILSELGTPDSVNIHFSKKNGSKYIAVISYKE